MLNGYGNLGILKTKWRFEIKYPQSKSKLPQELAIFSIQAPLCKGRGTYKYDFKVGQNLILASTYIHTFSSRDAIYRCCRLFGRCHVAKSYVNYHIVSVINMKLIEITIWHQHSTIIFSVPTITMLSDLHIILKVTRTNVTSTHTKT